MESPTHMQSEWRFSVPQRHLFQRRLHSLTLLSPPNDNCSNVLRPSNLQSNPYIGRQLSDRRTSPSPCPRRIRPSSQLRRSSRTHALPTHRRSLPLPLRPHPLLPKPIRRQQAPQSRPHPPTHNTPLLRPPLPSRHHPRPTPLPSPPATPRRDALDHHRSPLRPLRLLLFNPPPRRQRDSRSLRQLGCYPSAD